VLGLGEGANANAAAGRALLAHRIERGHEIRRALLSVIDGATALHRWLRCSGRTPCLSAGASTRNAISQPPCRNGGAVPAARDRRGRARSRAWLPQTRRLSRAADPGRRTARPRRAVQSYRAQA
jgi:hypothetical protein